MSLQIGKFFYKALNSNNAVRTAVNGRIFPVALRDDKDDVVPYIVYAPTGMNVNANKDDIEFSDVCTVDVIVCAGTYTAMLNLAESVRSAVNSADREDSSWPFIVTDITLSAGADEFDDLKPAYFKTLTYQVETIKK